MPLKLKEALQGGVTKLPHIHQHAHLLRIALLLKPFSLSPYKRHSLAQYGLPLYPQCGLRSPLATAALRSTILVKWIRLEAVDEAERGGIGLKERAEAFPDVPHEGDGE